MQNLDGLSGLANDRGISHSPTSSRSKHQASTTILLSDFSGSETTNHHYHASQIDSLVHGCFVEYSNSNSVQSPVETRFPFSNTVGQQCYDRARPSIRMNHAMKLVHLPSVACI